MADAPANGSPLGPDTGAGTGHAEISARDAALRRRMAAGEAVDRAEREAMMADIIAAGADTPPGLHRDRLRNLLFHWAANLALETGAMGDIPVLAPYVPREPPSGTAAAGPSGVPAPPAPPPRAPAGFEALSKGMIAVTAGNSARAVVSARAGPVSRTARRVRQRARALIAGRPPGKANAQPGSAPASAAADPEIVARGRTQELVRWGATARQWRNSRSPGLLVSGEALRAAERFAADDPDIRDFVEASLARRRIRRLGTLLALVLIGATALFAYLTFQHRRELRLLSEQAAAMTMRDDLSSRASAAVDALGQQNLEPLKALLRDLTGAADLPLDNLALVRTTAAEPAGDAAQAYGSPAPILDPSPLPALGTCSGYMWIGGTGDDGPPAPDFASLGPGDVLSITHANSVNLRASLPDEAYRTGRDRYTLGPIVGVVPGGARVTLLSRPFAYARPTGTRWWAEVEVPRQHCSRVYVQYLAVPPAPGTNRPPPPPPQLMAIQDTIGALGFITAPAQEIGTAAGRAEVRYYWDRDRDLAAHLAKALGSVLGVSIAPVALSNVPVRPEAGVLEVWIDLSTS